MMMESPTKVALNKRLARVAGQVEGVRRMVDNDEYCVDILTQIAAARSALDQAGAMLAASHVKTCLSGFGTDSQHRACPHKSKSNLLEELQVTLSRLMR